MVLELARALHRRVPPERWCITKAELDEFVEEVYLAWRRGDILENPQHSNPLHLDINHGPNLYAVNKHIVMPWTLAAGGMSYALMKHPDGLDCEVFVSHSWHGGIFHLRHGVRRGWPQLHRRRNLYCCLLANPQNLDLDEFLGGNLKDNAFTLALQNASHLLVVPNPCVGVYSRLWCVYEAYLGVKWNKIYLLPVMPRRKQTFIYWTKYVGIPMICGGLLGIPVFFVYQESWRRAESTLPNWISLFYRVLTMIAQLLVMPYRESAWALRMMTCLAAVGCIFLPVEVWWDYDDIRQCRRCENWIAVFFNYGYFVQLVLVNSVMAALLVILKSERIGFQEQQDMMQFDSLKLAHCSNQYDEQRIREAISGSEQEVETVIQILLSAGAYTDNLRRCWDAGFDVERAGFRDAKTGVVFCMLLWLLSTLDNISDLILASNTHQTHWVVAFAIICFLSSVSILAVPISVRWVEGHGPDRALFTMKVWWLFGSFSLQVPLLLCYVQGYAQVEGVPLDVLVNRRQFPNQFWQRTIHVPASITMTTLLVRFFCIVFAWLVLSAGLERWIKLRMTCQHKISNDHWFEDEDASDDSSNSSSHSS